MFLLLLVVHYSYYHHDDLLHTLMRCVVSVCICLVPFFFQVFGSVCGKISLKRKVRRWKVKEKREEEFKERYFPHNKFKRHRLSARLRKLKRRS